MINIYYSNQILKAIMLDSIFITLLPLYPIYLSIKSASWFPIINCYVILIIGFLLMAISGFISENANTFNYKALNKTIYKKNNPKIIVGMVLFIIPIIDLFISTILGIIKNIDHIKNEGFFEFILGLSSYIIPLMVEPIIAVFHGQWELFIMLYIVAPIGFLLVYTARQE